MIDEEDSVEFEQADTLLRFDLILQKLSQEKRTFQNWSPYEEETLSRISKESLDITEILSKYLPYIFATKNRLQLTKISDFGFLFFPKQDTIISKKIRETGQWEADETFWIRENLGAESTLLNLGSHIGYHAFLSTVKVSSRNVFAVEPNPNIVPILKANAWFTGLDINIIPYAIGRKCETVDFYEDYNNTGDGRIQKFIGSEFVGRIEVIDCLRLSQLIPPPDLIVMDIQGGEVSILRDLFKYSNENCKILFEFTPKAISNNISTAIQILKQRTSGLCVSQVGSKETQLDYELLRDKFLYEGIENINLVIKRG